MRVLIATAIAALATSAAGAVTVVNGDFQAGNTGFTSAYTYIPTGQEAQMGEAKYGIANDALATHSAFTSYFDHTFGTAVGSYMIVNGSSQANTIVWESSPIAVTQGRYNFGAFLSSAYFQSPALLQFTAQPNVGGTQSLGNFMAPATTGVSQGVGGDVIVGAGMTSITLRIVNQNTDLSGNDFGIDDITLTAVPEPATWGLLIAGFGMVGVAARRRRTALVA